MNTEFLKTAHGDTITAGSFVRFLQPIECAIAGPYRFEGYRDGRAFFSIVGIEFSVTEVPEGSIELLAWQDWQRPDFHLDRFLRFFYTGYASACVIEC